MPGNWLVSVTVCRKQTGGLVKLVYLLSVYLCIVDDRGETMRTFRQVSHNGRNRNKRRTGASGLLRLFCAVVFVFMIVPVLGCGSTTVSYPYTEKVTLTIGQSQKMTLQHIPAGLTESDYEWRVGTDAVEVDSNGVVTAIRPGESRVRGFAKLKSTVYEEFFYVIVPVDQGEIRSLTLSTKGKSPTDFVEIPLAVGTKIQLEVAIDADDPRLNADERYTWNTSYPDLIRLETPTYSHVQGIPGKNDEIAVIEGLAVGEVVVTAQFRGVTSNSVRIRIYQSTDSFEYIRAITEFNPPVIKDNTVIIDGRPNDKLPFFLTGAAGGSGPLASGYVMNLRPGSGELLDGLASAPKGKYAIIITPDFDSEDIEGIINEHSVVDLKAMRMLPAELLPNSAAEIEFILSIEYRARHQRTYGTGTKGMQIYAVAVVKDAKTGKVIRTISTEYGYSPPNYGYYNVGEEPPDKAYGSFDFNKQTALICKLIADVWQLEKGLTPEFKSM